MVLAIQGLSVHFGGVRALSDVSFDVGSEICGLIGPNGAGKSTLFNCISGLQVPTSGTIRFDGTELTGVRPHAIAKLGVGRSFQHVKLFPELSVLDNVRIGAHSSGGADFVRSSFRLGTRKEEAASFDKAANLLDFLGLTDVAHMKCKGLPYGTMKRIDLARALAGDPQLLLLDEPASGLTHSEVDELAGAVRRIRDTLKPSIVLVEHHMGIVMSLSDHVVVLDLGQVIADGSAGEVRHDPRVVAAYLGGAA